jgi:hypothetical protein
MGMAAHNVVALSVDRATKRWVVLNPEGQLWSSAPTGNPWDERQPFTPAEDAKLEPMTGHYKAVLGLPI